MRKRRSKLTWVDPEFHKKLKIASAKAGMNMLEFTKCSAELIEKEDFIGRVKGKRFLNQRLW